MSLLMDALKKAELAKRQAEAGAAPPPDQNPPQEEPAAARSPIELVEPEPHAPTIAPDLQRKLELLDDEFAGARAESGAQAAAGRADADRAAAQNLFAAKARPSRKPFLLTVAALVLVGAGFGGYVWWQIQPRSGVMAVSGPGAPAARPAPVAAAPQPGTVAPKPGEAATAAAAPPAPPAGGAAPAAEARPPRPRTDAAAEEQPAPRPRTRVRPAVPEGEPAIPIRAGRREQAVDADVAGGYESYRGGDLAAARRSYEKALRADPASRDALHGLAAIALRQGRPDLADAYYSRALEANPTDADAAAAQAMLRGHADAQQAESRLKTLLASQPDAHAAHFALGNLYAQRGAWGEAQQSYFRAYTGDSENPDYLYNLAVSLDRLRQPRLALQYYQLAVAATAARPAAFDRSQVAERVQALQQP